jgi:branched-chain amino acid transport system permease protein
MGFFLQQATNGIVLGCVYALFALGFSLVMANLKIFHVAHEGVFTWGAVMAWVFMDKLSMPLLVAAPLMIVAVGLLNVLLYGVLIRHLERRANRELAGFISSLGGLIVLVEGAAIVLDRKTVRLPFNAFPINTWDLGLIQISSIQVLMVGVALVAFAFMEWLVERTEVGREIKTVAYDRELASLLGVNSDLISAIVFFVSGAFGAISALLVAIAFNVVNSNLGSSFLVLAIAVTVIGGFGSVRGALVGGLLVGLASTYTTGYITSSYREVVVFAMMLVFLVARPTGLFKVAEAGHRA